jgi:uncharacterized protein (TIGR01777 family)
MSGRRSVLIVGGTGFIGSHLVPALLARGDVVWIWARDPRRARSAVPAAARLIGALDEIDAETPIDALVNLAGAPVVGPPWTQARRKLLIESRVGPTRALLEWCGRRRARPAVMISASAIGFYGTGGEHWLDENSPPNEEFQSRLCQQREAATADAAALGIRVSNLRLGLVLGADGGIFSRLALAARFGAAAVLGDGKQWMSWVHITDVLRVIERSLDDGGLTGALNVVAPEPVRQRDFQVALTRRLHRPLWLRVPEWPLRLMLGEMSDLLLRSQRVAPRRLQESGFEFRYPSLEAALTDLLRRERS